MATFVVLLDETSCIDREYLDRVSIYSQREGDKDLELDVLIRCLGWLWKGQKSVYVGGAEDG